MIGQKWRNDQLSRTVIKATDVYGARESGVILVCLHAYADDIKQARAPMYARACAHTQKLDIFTNIQALTNLVHCTWRNNL